MDDDIAIKVHNVSKTFKLPHEKHSSLKGLFINIFRGRRVFERQKVLDDVSFEIKKGEFFGIAGRNGSGKSTLLKLIAGIYTPNKGRIDVNGRLTPFIELGVGFNPELTGRENVFLNGALLGFDRSKMESMYEEIVTFAELERFMDQKLKNYSSGMQVRLAFSIAIRAKSDILLLDEVLAVGDAAFQRKCFNYFGELKRNKQTVIFISHDMASIRKYCDRAILIDKGVITTKGSVNKVVEAYTDLFMQQVGKEVDSKVEKNAPIGMSPSGKIDKEILSISNIKITDSISKEINHVDRGAETISVSFDIIAKKDVSGFVPGVIVQNIEGEFITATNIRWAKEVPPEQLITAGEKISVTFELPNIYEKGTYNFSINVVSKDLEVFYAWKNNALKVYIERSFETGAKVYPIFNVRYS